MNALNLLAIVAAAFADPTEHEKVKGKYDGDHLAYLKKACSEWSAEQVSKVGSKTKVCQELDKEGLECLEDRAGDKRLIMLLDYKCITDMATENSEMLDKVWGEIKDDKAEIKQFFASRGAQFCPDKARFKDCPDMYEKLKAQCGTVLAQEGKKAAEKELEETKKKMEEMEKGKKNESFIFGLSSALVMLTTAILFAVVF